MKEIKFIGKVPPYNIGEVATFDDVRAARYVEIHAAVYTELKNVSAPPEDKMVRPSEVKKK